MVATPELAVNLATHNRARFLEPCLVSLCQQTANKDRYEICVIANACSDDTPAVFAAVAARYPHHHLRLIEEPTPGVSRARNRCIAETTTPLIANIDDDATANPDWVDVFLKRFDELPADVGMIGGEVDPVWQVPPPPWLTQWMKGILSAASNMGPMARIIESHEGLFEGNCCYRRSTIESIGLYPTELGRVGGSLLSGEGAVNTLLRQQGWKLFFDPAALIHHTIHADRLNPMWFRKRYFWQGVSDYHMHCFLKRHGLDLLDEISIELPLSPEDWRFIQNDTAEGLQPNMLHFESLGFVLAMTGILQID